MMHFVVVVVRIRMSADNKSAEITGCSDDLCDDIQDMKPAAKSMQKATQKKNPKPARLSLPSAMSNMMLTQPSPPSPPPRETEESPSPTQNNGFLSPDSMPLAQRFPTTFGLVPAASPFSPGATSHAAVTSSPCGTTSAVASAVKSDAKGTTSVVASVKGDTAKASVTSSSDDMMVDEEEGKLHRDQLWRTVNISQLTL